MPSRSDVDYNDPMYDDHQMCMCGGMCYCGCGSDFSNTKHYWDGRPCAGSAMNKYASSDEDWLR